MSRKILLLLFTGLAAFAAGPVSAKVFLSVNEALRLVFGDAKVEHQTVFLTTGQRAQAQKLAGGEIKSALVNPYRATRDGKEVGTAYFDSHVVRTLPETLMVVVDPQGKVSRVEVLAFAEPEDYLPPGRWYGQFLGNGLSDELALGRRIRSVTGASLTARATTEAVRRVLAIHQVLRGTGKP
ncbi:MAG TPA: FMN-binding protein [Thermoanaerobaculia bacterium]|nr:FMN-binding protein [Thermoanaerobaculia bacterium]